MIKRSLNNYIIYVYYCILYMCTIAYNMSVFSDERPSEYVILNM